MGKSIVVSSLSGISQIVFMNHPLAGAIFLLAIILYSPFMAFACCIGVISANVVAELSRRPIQMIRQGIYGFNGALLGLSLSIFIEHDWLIWIFLILGGGVTVFFYEIISKFGIPPLTFPFVVLTWFIMQVANRSGIDTPVDTNWTLSSLLGIGQIFFLESDMSGIIILLAIAIYSYRLAFWAWIGALIGMFPSLWVFDQNVVNSGLISLNTALCTIGTMRLIPHTNMIRTVSLTFLTAFTYPFFYFILSFFQLPTLTFPFIISLWLGVVYQRVLDKRSGRARPISKKQEL